MKQKEISEVVPIPKLKSNISWLLVTDIFRQADFKFTKKIFHLQKDRYPAPFGEVENDCEFMKIQFPREIGYTPDYCRFTLQKKFNQTFVLREKISLGKHYPCSSASIIGMTKLLKSLTYVQAL
jgi:hypothetical protein